MRPLPRWALGNGVDPKAQIQASSGIWGLASSLQGPIMAGLSLATRIDEGPNLPEA